MIQIYKIGEARRGEARRGEARRGEARRGEARRGEARRRNIIHYLCRKQGTTRCRDQQFGCIGIPLEILNRFIECLAKICILCLSAFMCVLVFACECVYACVCLCLHVNVFMHVCACVCM